MTTMSAQLKDDGARFDAIGRHMAFGQPRQDELIELFSGMSEEVVSELAEFQISLRPGMRLNAQPDHSTTG
jgi:hypothetical protein